MSENCAYFSHSSIFSKIGRMCSDLLETGGMYCRNGGYVLLKWGVCISCRKMGGGGMCCRNGGYVLWKCGVCIAVAKMGYVL